MDDLFHRIVYAVYIAISFNVILYPSVPVSLIYIKRYLCVQIVGIYTLTKAAGVVSILETDNATEQYTCKAHLSYISLLFFLFFFFDPLTGTGLRSWWPDIPINFP